MRVLFLPVGDRESPGTRLRTLSYVPFIRGRGHEVKVLFPVSVGSVERRRRRLVRSIEVLRDAAIARHYDLVVVYRKTYPGISSRVLRATARKIVFEFDDAIFSPSPSEPQGPKENERYLKNFLGMIDVADHVVAGNRFLADAAGDIPCSVLPTGVDLRIFRPSDRPRKPAGCVLGWIGTAENLPQWERLIPAFRQVCAEHPSVRFKIVSNRKPPPYDLPVEFERFTIDREAECIQDFDIGLMPLEDTPWNRGKCSMKALQCMAVETPVVISPVGMNNDIIKPQVSGLFASTEKEWALELGRLVASPEVRRAMGKAARKVVEESFSLEVIGPRMADLLERMGGS